MPFDELSLWAFSNRPGKALPARAWRPSATAMAEATVDAGHQRSLGQLLGDLSGGGTAFS